LQNRQAGAHQSQELLIEKEEALRRDDFSRFREQVAQRDGAALGVEHPHPLLSQLILGRAHAGRLDVPLDDLTVGHSDPENKFGHCGSQLAL